MLLLVMHRAPMETLSRSSPHRSLRSPHSSPPTRRSSWASSPRPPRITSRSCYSPVLNTGCANGGTRTPTKFIGDSNGHGPRNTATPTNSRADQTRAHAALRCDWIPAITDGAVVLRLPRPQGAYPLGHRPDAVVPSRAHAQTGLVQIGPSKRLPWLRAMPEVRPTGRRGRPWTTTALVLAAMPSRRGQEAWLSRERARAVFPSKEAMFEAAKAEALIPRPDAALAAIGSSR